jgi:hypothetical protein
MGIVTHDGAALGSRLRALVRTTLLLLASGVWLRLATLRLIPRSRFEVFVLLLLLLTVAANVTLMMRGRGAGRDLIALVAAMNVASFAVTLFAVYAIVSFLRTFH